MPPTKKDLKLLYRYFLYIEQDHNKLEEVLAVPLEVWTYNQREQPKSNHDLKIFHSYDQLKTTKERIFLHFVIFNSPSV